MNMFKWSVASAIILTACLHAWFNQTLLSKYTTNEFCFVPRDVIIIKMKSMLNRFISFLLFWFPSKCQCMKLFPYIDGSYRRAYI